MIGHRLSGDIPLFCLAVCGGLLQAAVEPAQGQSRKDRKESAEGQPLAVRQVMQVRLPDKPGDTSASVSLSRDGKLLAIGAANAGRNGQVEVWGVKTGKCLLKLDGTAPVSFSPDGKLLACGGQWGRRSHLLQIFQTSDGKQIRHWKRLFGDAMQSILWTADGTQMVVSALDMRIRVFEPKTGRHTYSWLPQNLDGGEASLSPENRLLFHGRYDRNRLFKDVIAVRDMKSKDLLFQLPTEDGVGPRRAAAAHHGAISSLDVSPDGLFLVSGDQAGKICIWETATGEMLAFQPVPKDTKPVFVAIHHDGRRILAARQSGSFELLDIVRGKTLGKLNTLGPLCGLSLSADGRRLAVISTDGTAKVLDISTWPQVKLKAEKHPADELNKLWRRLAQRDAAKTPKMFVALLRGQNQTVAFFKKKLKPAPSIDPKEIPKLIDALDDAKDQVRQQAFEKLAILGFQAVPALREALSGKGAKEARSQIEKLLAIPGLVKSAESLRRVRAIRVLMLIGSPEAVEALQTLARGGAEIYETQLAKAALRRLRAK